MPATLLLIDDNPIQAATRQTILRRAGYHVIALLNPERALETFRAHEFPTPIDLIITDHLMLRTIAPTLPVLVISGMADAEEEYRDLGVDFRLKPLLPDNLLATVHRLVEAGVSTQTA
jgi:CheY-like chemotaxis protein